jgi:hypothetical protein
VAFLKTLTVPISPPTPVVPGESIIPPARTFRAINQKNPLTSPLCLGTRHGVGRLGLEYRPSLRNNANPGLECGRSSGVEHNLAKVRVARSNRVARSKINQL